MSQPGDRSVEVDHVTPYLMFLFVMLSTATLFDGFDSGIPWAIAVVAVGPILGAALVLWLAPETRGLTLEQIQESLASGEPGPEVAPSGRRSA